MELFILLMVFSATLALCFVLYHNKLRRQEEPTDQWDNWKNDFLDLENQIEDFIQKRLVPVGNENVARLLEYHLERSKELLWAEVQGGLEDEYKIEAEEIPQDWIDSMRLFDLRYPEMRKRRGYN